MYLVTRWAFSYSLSLCHRCQQAPLSIIVQWGNAEADSGQVGLSHNWTHFSPPCDSLFRNAPAHLTPWAVPVKSWFAHRHGQRHINSMPCRLAQGKPTTHTNKSNSALIWKGVRAEEGELMEGGRERKKDMAFAVFPPLNELHFALRRRDENEGASNWKRLRGYFETKQRGYEGRLCSWFRDLLYLLSLLRESVSPVQSLNIKISAMGCVKAIMAAGWGCDGPFLVCPWTAWPLTWDHHN